jgi:hypothetical protein
MSAVPSRWTELVKDAGRGGRTRRRAQRGVQAGALAVFGLAQRRHPGRHFFAANRGEQLIQHEPRVAVDRDVGLPVLAEHLAVEVDVHELASRLKRRAPAVLEAKIEGRPHDEHQVALDESKPSGVGKEGRMILGEGAARHAVQEDGGTNAVGEPPDDGGVGSPPQLRTQDEDGALRAPQQIRGSRHGLRVTRRPGRGRRLRSAFALRRAGHEHVERDLQVDGARHVG